MTDPQREAAERGFVDRLEGRRENPYLDQGMARLWQEGNEAGGRLMRGRDRLDSFDQVEKLKAPLPAARLSDLSPAPAKTRRDR